ncbi:MAG: dihydroorotate dehydrogenase PyrD [Desulfurococcaceae archaeon]
MQLEHPVLNASGILGSEPEHITILVNAGFSAIVTKTFTVRPREGYQPPILVELNNYSFLNAVGLPNPGIDFIPGFIAKIKDFKKPIILSIGGNYIEEYAKLAIVAEEAGVDAIEVNLSCPHVKGYGLEIGSDPSSVRDVIKNIASVIKIPIIVKLGVSDRVVESAGKALEAGAKAITLINTIKAMAIDIYTKTPILSNKQGGLSGASIRPIAIRVVYDVFKEYRPEIIGCGGIISWRDAAEFILAGAKAVQIGSAFLKNPRIVFETIEGLRDWVTFLGFHSLEELVGAAHK